MTAHPILFSAPMVRAILAGRKTQTRRVVTPQPEHHAGAAASLCSTEDWTAGPNEWRIDAAGPLQDGGGATFLRCPYGAPGDRLWVREAFRLAEHHDDLPPREFCARHEVSMWYEADGAGVHIKANDTIRPGRLRPSIHMPRWASRLTLEVTDVRVERVQDIDDADALAEGVAGATFAGADGEIDLRLRPRAAFKSLWDGINTGRGFSFESNPFVWVVSFQVQK